MTIKKTTMTVFAAVVSLCAFSENATCVWRGGSGSWNNDDNWNGGVPDATDIAQFPKGSATYTVTVDGDVDCLHLRCEGGSGSRVIYFQGGEQGGSITCHGDAGGPSLNSYLNSGFEAVFRNLTVSMPRFNPKGGVFRVQGGASFNVDYLYISANSLVAIDGGNMAVNGNIDIRGKCQLVVKNGEFNHSSGNLVTSSGDYSSGLEVVVSGGRYSNASFSFTATKPVTVRQTGGIFEMRNSPTGFGHANSTVDISNGTMIFKNSFILPDHAAWVPKAGQLILEKDSYEALTIKPGATLALNGISAYVTNNLIKNTTVTTYPGVFANTNSTITGSGTLYANYMFVRSTCTVEVAKLCLGDRVHLANANAVLSVPNGITFGAYADWTSAYQSAYNLLSGHITVETADCFDGVTPRTITLGRAKLDTGVDYLVTGTGTNCIELHAQRMWINSLTVDSGATFKVLGTRYRYSSGTTGIQMGTLQVPQLVLGPNSKLVTVAGLSAVQASAISADPSARIAVEVPAGTTAGELHAVMMSPDTDSLPAQIVLEGAGAENWELRRAAGTAYLADGAQTVSYSPEGTVTNDWMGVDGGLFSTDGNWSSGNRPTSSTQHIITQPDAVCLSFPGGTAQTVVTNDLSDASFNDTNGLAVCCMKFQASAGPYEVHGNPICLWSQAYSTDVSPLYSASAFPTVFYAPICRTSGKLGIVTGGTTGYGYFSFMGPVWSSNADLYIRGDVRFGNEATFKGIYFYDPIAQNPNRLTVLNGGRFYAKGNDSLLGQSGSAAGIIDVRAGGSLVYDGKWIVNPKPGLTYIVDGRFAVSNTFVSAKTAPFSGKGTVYLAGVESSTAAVQAKFDGELTLEMGGDWKCVCADNPNTIFPLHVISGNLTLKAASNWSYGLPEGVATSTDAADRAIVIDKGATLTIGASEHVTTLRDPIIGEGTLAFEPGARINVGGALYAAALPRVGWATIATVGAISGTPTLPERCKMAVEDNGDGTVSLKVHFSPGLVVTFR